jgi:N6-adenosine-specific RNA methylase IME4
MNTSPKFKTIVIDPPWPCHKTGKRLVRPNQDIYLPYRTMNIQTIATLPIQDLLGDDSLLFIWATNARVGPFPTYVHACNLIVTWGCTYYTTLTWDKSTGACPFGPIQITSEYLIMAYSGKFTFDKSRMGKIKSVLSMPKTSHSAKPSGVYDLIASISYPPRLDMFARQAHDGFYGWGDEYIGDEIHIPVLEHWAKSSTATMTG